MGSADAGEQSIDAVIEEQAFPLRFVPSPRTLELVEVAHLPDVMEYDAGADERHVERETETPQLGEEPLAGLAHEFAVSEEARGGANRPK